MELTAADILEKAADIISVQGLNKGFYRNGRTGQVCSVGALRQVVTGDPTTAIAGSHSAHPSYVEALLALQTSIGAGTVAVWNDQHSRTEAEVVEQMRRVAKDLRNEAVPDA